MLTENSFDRLVARVDRLEKTLQRENVDLYVEPITPKPTYAKAAAKNLRFETGIAGHMAFFEFDCGGITEQQGGHTHHSSALVPPDAKYELAFDIRPVGGCRTTTTVLLKWATKQ